jgi:hypothetical protein
LASVRRPGILGNKVVFYNRTEEEMLTHLDQVPRHEHVHWLFKELMKEQEAFLANLRRELPTVRIVYSIDSDDLHSTCERMLRVIVQSAQLKVSTSRKSLQGRCQELQRMLTGTGQVKRVDRLKKLALLEEKRKKAITKREKNRAKLIAKDIAVLKAEILLFEKRDRLQAELKVYEQAKNDTLAKKTRVQLNRVKQAIGAKEEGLEKHLVVLTAKRNALGAVPGAAARRKALDQEIDRCSVRIEEVRGRITRLEKKMEELELQYENFREPETSAVYQRRVAEHVDKLYQRFDTLGEKYYIDIMKEPGIVVFGTLVIDYAHDRGRTWHPMPGRVKRLAEAYHGTMEDYRANVTKTLDEMKAPVRDIDVIMESGHHGVFFARWQRLNLTPEEIRMQHVNTFYTGGSDGVKHVTYVVGMPFEPQDQISKYLNRGKPSRTRAGKPISSAAHPVFTRNTQGSVAGVVLVRKHRHSLVSVEAIEYNQYRNKEVLQPFQAFMSQDDSDNHFGSPEMDPLGTLGTLAMNDALLEKPMELYGAKVHLAGKCNIGDSVEAGSRAWKEGHKFRRQVMGEVESIAAQLVGTDTDDYESVMQTLLVWLNDMMGGANENMKLNGRLAGWYFKKQFLNTLRSPVRLRDLFVHTEGNHWANSVRDLGFKEYDAFENWLLALQHLHEDFPLLCSAPFSLKIMAGGEPQYFQPDMGDRKMVVHLGGYSVSRQAYVEAYGVGYDGSLLCQKPYRLGLSHEPNSAENKAVNQAADVHKNGHTHESFLVAVKSGDNKVRFIDQKPCTQRVTATELIYGGIPRTSGVDLCIYTQPGRYQKMTIPMEHMRRIGFAWLLSVAKKLVDERRALRQMAAKPSVETAPAPKQKKRSKK